MHPLAFLTIGIASLGQLANAHAIDPRAYTFPDSSCSDDQKKVINDEMNWAMKMALEVGNGAGRFKFYETFFSKQTRKDPAHKTAVEQVFMNSGNMLWSGNHDHDITVKCNAQTAGCLKEWYAHFNSGTNIMNFCPNFFDPKKGLFPTQTSIDNCKKLDLRSAQRSRSAIIVHETAHSSWVMETKTNGRFKANWQLPQGKFDRSCAPWVKEGDEVLCPDPDDPKKEGTCDAELASNNADTYSLVAAGIFFSVRCKAPKDGIPMPDPPEEPKLRARAPDTPPPPPVQKPNCPANDWIVWDGPVKSED